MAVITTTVPTPTVLTMNTMTFMTTTASTTTVLTVTTTYITHKCNHPPLFYYRYIAIWFLIFRLKLKKIL